MFEPSGTVNSAVIATDKSSGRSKGFGFVDMASEGEAQAAIASLNGTTVDSRTLRVEVAKLPERAGEAQRS
jgi:RNA recognition motif-containing protein